MKDLKLKLILLTAMLMLLVPIHFVKADSWVEVIRFEGTSGISEKHFACGYVEWRIRWEFDSGHWHFFPPSFTVATYREGEDLYLVDSIHEMANESTSGTSYIHDNYTQYYMAIRAWDTENYTIIIEQNIDSIPEFPSWIILPLLLATTSAFMICRKKPYRARHWRSMANCHNEFLNLLYSQNNGRKRGICAHVRD